MDKDAPIPGMDLDFKYSDKKPAMMPSNVGPVSKELEATKKELNKCKKLDPKTTGLAYFCNSILCGCLGFYSCFLFCCPILF